MLATVILIFSSLSFCNLIKAEQCLPGEFHKKTSSPGGSDYAECQAWNNNTCCTANFTAELNQNRVKNLYNFHWGHCKNLSLACERYILAEECFYSCEPRLIRWQVVNTSLAGIPVCGDYCDEWYRACENDQTCVEDWFGGFNFTNNAYTCPRGSECRTFKQVYGNGRNLCNKMWGRTFVFVDPMHCPCTRLDEPIPTNVNVSTCSLPIPTITSHPPRPSASRSPPTPTTDKVTTTAGPTPTTENVTTTAGGSSISTFLPFNLFLITLELCFT